DTDEDRESSSGPEQGADHPGLHADLRVVRLPGFDRGPGARSCLARVTEPVALRVMDHGPHALSQADPVIVQRRLVQARRIAARAGLLTRVLALLDQVRACPFS